MAVVKKKAISGKAVKRTTASTPSRRKETAKRTATKQAKRIKSARAVKQSTLTFSRGQDYILEALANVKKELIRLDDEKDSLNRKLRSVENAMTRAKLEEARLRDDLSKTVAREGLISNRAKKIKAKLIDLKDRITKVASIKDTLSNSR